MIRLNQGEAAETIVKMSLNGAESAIRITGSGLKEVVAIMIALSKNRTQLKGKTNLTNMLKSGKELKVFPVKEKDFETFVKQAKKYGILYSALINKKRDNADGFVDVMVRAEDAPKINRIFERFKLTAFDETEIKAEINKDKVDKMVKEGLEKGVKVKEINDSKFVDEILGKGKNEIVNPSLKRMEKNNPSELSSGNKKNLEGISDKQRVSVREEIKNIKEEQQKGRSNEINNKNKTRQKPIKKKNVIERG